MYYRYCNSCSIIYFFKRPFFIFIQKTLLKSLGLLCKHQQMLDDFQQIKGFKQSTIFPQLILYSQDIIFLLDFLYLISRKLCKLQKRNFKLYFNRKIYALVGISTMLRFLLTAPKALQNSIFKLHSLVLFIVTYEI